MGLEDLIALAEAAAEEAAEEEKQERPPYEPMFCTLNSGAKVIFDVPDTRP